MPNHLQLRSSIKILDNIVKETLLMFPAQFPEFHCQEVNRLFELYSSADDAYDRNDYEAMNKFLTQAEKTALTIHDNLIDEQDKEMWAGYIHHKTDSFSSYFILKNRLLN